MFKKNISEIARLLECKWFGEDIEVEGVCFDSRKVEPGQLYIPLIGERNNGHDYINQVIEKQANAALWSQDEIPSGISILKVDNTLEAMKKLASIYAKECGFKVVAVTGSNGKTSTKDILASCLAQKYKVGFPKGNYNSDIGMSYTILMMDKDVEVAVLEMGMENFHEIEELCKIATPCVSIVTNVGTAHMENLGSIENIAKAKCEILDGLLPGGTFIYNLDDEILCQEVKHHDHNVHKMTFGTHQNSDCHIDSFEMNDAGMLLKTNMTPMIQAPLIGRHQALNACAAILASKAMGLTDDQILQGFKEVKMTHWRTQLEKAGKCIILNDAYKSNPESARAALNTLKELNAQRKIVVWGDMFDLGPDSKQMHIQLGLDTIEVEPEMVYGIGEDCKHMINALKDKGMKAFHTSTQEELINELKQYLNQECMILIKGSRGMHLDLVVEALKGEANHE